MTPMMQQYLAVKESVPDALLMFRLGDFYELFFDDAVTASKLLEITLTGRDAGPAGRVPMCGVPFHAVDGYIHRLTEAGYRVAICEQTEDPKQAKGLVRREVVRIVTPGTALRDDANNRYLAALVQRREDWGFSAVDVNTGEAWCGQDSDVATIQDWLQQWRPAELLVDEQVTSSPEASWIHTWRANQDSRITGRRAFRQPAADVEEVLHHQYHVRGLASLGLDASPAAAEALATAIAYIQETQKTALTHLWPPRDMTQERCLLLDYTAQRNLELLETVRTRSRKGSLYGLLDETKTSMGSRLLRRWIERPLQDVAMIRSRQDAIQAFIDDVFVRGTVDEALKDVYDLDRLVGRVAFGSANARDLLAIAGSLAVIPALKDVMERSNAPRLLKLADELPDVSRLCAQIQNTLVPDPPVGIRDGGLIQPGVDTELDELRALHTGGKQWLAALEQRERDRTGIKTLKVGFNKVFGYYLEVSKSNVGLVPADYERRQTLSTGERYVIPELKEQEARILHAEEQALEKEYALFTALRDAVLDALHQIRQVSAIIAEVDVYSALAKVAAAQGYVRPDVVSNRGIDIVRGRHPMVEAAHPGSFVPNDVGLNASQQLILLTGPNMAGKSTYMRQTAIIVVMAHMGSFVPAESAVIGLVDRVFTRIGASDDLTAGQSTFMVEMVELANILRLATDKSLVLLDEIGRGTSTYDGLCIAEAVVEELVLSKRRPLTLFATHYHELTQTVAELQEIANFSVAVEETPAGVTFLHAVVPRPADKSYGIQVARLAGIPESVVARANQLLAVRETAAGAAAPVHNPKPEMKKAATVPLPVAAVLQQVAELDVLNMTPIEALNTLHQLQRTAKEVSEWVPSE